MAEMNSINPPAGGVTLCSCGLTLMTSGPTPAQTISLSPQTKEDTRSIHCLQAGICFAILFRENFEVEYHI